MSKTLMLCILVCLCLVAGCAARGGGGEDVRASAESSPTLHVPGSVAEKYFWIDIKDKTRQATGLESILTALLQSDKGVLLADNEHAADYILRVTVVETGIVDRQAVGMALRDTVAPLLVGTLGGTAVGGAVGGQTGAAWGAGIGALLGIGYAWAEGSDKTNYVWSMLADVAILDTKEDASRKEYKSRMAATVEGVDIPKDQAIPLLEDALAAEITAAFGGQEAP